MGSAASKVRTKAVPSWVIKLLTLKNKKLKNIVKLLDLNMDASGDKARRLLGWAPRSQEDAIIAAAESLVKLGLV